MRFIPVGRVIAGHGLNGAVKFQYYNEDVDQFGFYTSLYADIGGRQTKFNLTEVRFRKGFFYLKLEDLNSPEKISFLINQELSVREVDLPLLDNDEYYDYQLIGLNVVNHKHEPVGVVTHVIHTGVNDILTVTGREEILVPMVEGLISKIDLQNTLIVIDEDTLRL
jgi:16S rRNA processing protein RimM